MPINDIFRQATGVVLSKAVLPKTEVFDHEKLIGEIIREGGLGATRTYMNTIQNVSTGGNLTGANNIMTALDEPTFNNGQLEAPHYMLMGSYSIDPYTEAGFGKVGMPFSAQKLLSTLVEIGMYVRQGYGTVFGFRANLKQGLYKNAYADSILPADSKGHTTVSTYNAYELYDFITSVLTSMSADAFNRYKRFTFACNYNFYNYISKVMIKLTDMQAGGGGTMTIRDAIDVVAKNLTRIEGGEGQGVTWLTSNMFTGIGSNNNDVILIVAPDDSKKVEGSLDAIQSGDIPNTMMNVSVPLYSYVNPTVDEVTKTVFKTVQTSGMAIIKEAIRTITYKY